MKSLHRQFSSHRVRRARHSPAAQDKAAAADVKRGRYLVQIAGCNDCHTPGYPESAGKVDEKLWLTGSPLGWRGPWGTTYATNLRLVAQTMTEAQWLKRARSELRPADALVQPARHERRGPAGDVSLHQAPGPGGRAGARLRAARQGAEAAVRAVPRAAEVAQPAPPARARRRNSRRVFGP